MDLIHFTGGDTSVLISIAIESYRFFGGASFNPNSVVMTCYDFGVDLISLIPSNWFFLCFSMRLGAGGSSHLRELGDGGGPSMPRGVLACVVINTS